MLQIILSFLKKQYFNIKMIKKYQLGFTLVELLVASLIIAFIAGSIMYGLSSSNNRLRNTELSQLAFNTLANKIEELKAQVALDRIQSISTSNKKICIEYKSIKDLMSDDESESRCRTVGYYSYKMKNRKTASLRTRVYDIEAKMKWKTIPRFWGDKGIDTVLTLNVSQLVFN